MAALAALTLGLGLAGWALWVEPRRVVVRRITLRLPRWPARLDGFSIALLSDLHAGAPHVDERKVAHVVALVQRHRPDLVTLLGDYVDHEVAFSSGLAPEPVAERLGRLRAPLGVLAVLGNHDWRADGERVRRALHDAGIRVLEDEAVQLARGPAPLWAAGLADARERDRDPDLVFEGVPDDATLLVLSHDPDLFPRVPSRAALTLSGHTHGAQVDIPVLRRRVIPSRFGDRYAAGHVVEAGRHLFVTRGVGTSTFPVRFRAPPEVVILRLRPAAR